MGTLFLVGISVVTLSGINQLSSLQVKAEPTEYSVTFTESNTTVETVDGNYAICTTTASGNKVGVVGYRNDYSSFTFHDVSFKDLDLYNIVGVLEEVDAYQFSTITGFAISFSGTGSMSFSGGMGMNINYLKSGEEHKGLSIAPSACPRFTTSSGSFNVSSLTIWYSC